MEDWKAFRAVRLSALKDAPHAFGSTWEGEKDRAEPDWRRAVVARERFVAETDEQVVGMASGGPSGSGGVASLTSLWVDPASRGQGVGDALVETIVEWAREAGYEQLVLWVTDGNSPAEKLYERHGFRRTGATQRIRAGEERLEFEMSVRL